MKTGTAVAMNLSPSRAEALAQKLERSQFSANCSSEEFAMICYALRSFVRPEVATLGAKLLFDTSKGCSVCGGLPVVNVSGTYWLCGPCVNERLEPQNGSQS